MCTQGNLKEPGKKERDKIEIYSWKRVAPSEIKFSAYSTECIPQTGMQWAPESRSLTYSVGTAGNWGGSPEVRTP